MPPLIHEDVSDDESPTDGVLAHTESKVEADVEAKDQLKSDLADNIGEVKGAEAAKAEKERLSPTASNADEDDEDEEDAYEVEAIVGHEWRKKKGKNQQPVLLYNVKWKGWGSENNTLEPEDNLVGSRDILAIYHHKIGGTPQSERRKAEPSRKASKKSLRDESMASATDDSAAPPSKRQKRVKQEDSTAQSDEEMEDNFGTWQPPAASWEKEIKEIQTVERDEKTEDLYILMIFKNGKKSRVKNGLVRKKCPQRLLDFYEEHLSV